MDAEDDIRKLTGEVSKVAFVALAGPLCLQTPTTRTASGICAAMRHQRRIGSSRQCFAPRCRGDTPGSGINTSVAARRAGIQKKVGWHAFRHTYSTLLVANGVNLKVVQELMRHARACTTPIAECRFRLVPVRAFSVLTRFARRLGAHRRSKEAQWNGR